MTQDSAARTQRFFVGAAVAALAAAVYANALRNGLVWDDPIVLDRQLLAFRSLGDVLFPPRNIPQFSPDYYRPLTTLSYLLDRAVGGSGPFIFHLSVVMYHVVATYLVFQLGLALFAGQALSLWAAGVGAALFAVHPIHTESVAWGAGRSDVLACCFSVAAAAVYVGGRWPPLQRTIVSAALLFAGMLAKETAVALVLLLPASDFFFNGRPTTAVRSPGRAGTRADRRRQRDVPAAARTVPALSYAPFAMVLLAYLMLRRVALGSLAGTTATVGSGLVANVVAAVGVYIGKLLMPMRQSAYISELPTSLPGLLVAGVLIVAAVGGGVWSWRRNERRITFLLLWVALTLAPSLAIIIKIPAAPVAERYLYLPSVGFCLLVGYGAALGITSLAGIRRLAVIIGCGLVLAVAAGATVARNAVWRSNLSLWEDTASKNAIDGLPVRSLATAFQRRGDAAKATEYFREALRRRNNEIGRFTIYNNLGSLAMVANHLDEAQRQYETALSINPQASEVLYNLGLIGLTRATATDGGHDPAWRHAQAARARRYFERAEALSPLDPDIQVGLAQTLSALGENAAARTHYARALKLGLPAATETAVKRRLAELK